MFSFFAFFSFCGVSIGACLLSFFSLSPPGMTVRIFEHIDGILEVECNAQKLDFSADVLTMTLFRRQSTETSLMAFVSPKTSECTTAEAFSSCVVDGGSSRNTRLKTLVLDLRVGEARVFGCNVTSLDSQKRLVTTSWSLVVVRNSKCWRRRVLFLWWLLAKRAISRRTMQPGLIFGM